jgi:hypothetical protein
MKTKRGIMTQSVWLVALTIGVMAGSSFGVLVTETFDSGIPASWTIVDNFPIPGGTGIPAYSAVPWTTNLLETNRFGPGTMGNYTDRTGQAATASSYNHTGQYDVSLITPVFAISVAPEDYTFRYFINYQHADAFEAFDTDISINGDPWLNMVRDKSSLGAFWSAGPPHIVRTINLGFFGAKPGDLVQVRFRYYSTYLLPMVWNEYVQIDDVTMATPEPATLVLLGLGAALVRKR